MLGSCVGAGSIYTFQPAAVGLQRCGVSCGKGIIVARTKLGYAQYEVMSHVMWLAVCMNSDRRMMSDAAQAFCKGKLIAQRALHRCKPAAALLSGYWQQGDMLNASATNTTLSHEAMLAQYCHLINAFSTLRFDLVRIALVLRLEIKVFVCRPEEHLTDRKTRSATLRPEEECSLR